MEMQIGTKFTQSYAGCVNPLSFEVVSISRPSNSVIVTFTNSDRYQWSETWDDLDITETAFEIGEYTLVTN